MRHAVGVVLTDSHLKKGNEDTIGRIMSRVDEVAQELSCPIFHLGDWFTSRTGQPLSVLLKTTEIIENLKSTVYIIPGNHDKTDLNSEASFLDVFSSERFKVFSRAFTIDFAHRLMTPEDPQLVFHMLPYFKESGEVYMEQLSKLTKKIQEKYEDCINVLGTHIAVNGVQNNDGSTVSEAIPAGAFKAFDLVLVGHYHNQQEFENILYMGSTHQTNYGEDSSKGYLVLYNDLSLEFHSFDFVEKYSKVSVDVASLNAEQLERFAAMKENGRLRVVLTGDRAKVQSFDTSLLTELGIDYDKRPEKIEMPDSEEMEQRTFNADSILKAFDNFCEINNIEDTKYGVEKLKSL